ncbi:hypothetical protein K402DRAFT_454632 [Aulographum hederae CBS 113979]|uniref:Uncharacterized protein n=1 Tax=Aulographum hederae CBS 113979 TaxID=1176131 RepID=A0A6G1GYA5_9PEZI|nr:hypothetical protein K402DRAFT_454632 [Aulographum hederae CBS 113979]
MSGTPYGTTTPACREETRTLPLMVHARDISDLDSVVSEAAVVNLGLQEDDGWELWEIEWDVVVVVPGSARQSPAAGLSLLNLVAAFTSNHHPRDTRPPASFLPCPFSVFFRLRS